MFNLNSRTIKIIAVVILQAFCLTQSGLAAAFSYGKNLRQVQDVEGKGAEAIGNALGVTAAHAQAVGTPEEAMEEFRRLYRENRFIILANQKVDFYGINSEPDNNDEVFGRLDQQNINRQLLVDIANAPFTTDARNVVIDLRMLTGLLPGNYFNLPPEGRNEILRTALPMARFAIQGTDGWRRDVSAENSEDPNVLCPANIREYAFSYGMGTRTLLEQTGQIKKGDRVEIVVGYDPRDPDRLLINSIIEGLRLAGVDVIDAGISSTPGAPIYMLYRGAHGAIQLTASHNRGREPGDAFLGQNGTKLFLYFNGLKLFPNDEMGSDYQEEMGMTSLYYSVHGRSLAEIAKQNGWHEGAVETTDQGAEAVMERLMHDPVNSWALAPDGTPIEKPLDDRTMVVVDCARGAYASRSDNPEDLGIVARRFEELGAHVEEPVECRNLGDGTVNYRSGAGFIEGFHRRDKIERSDVENGELSGFPSLERLFQLGSANRRAIERGEKRVIGVLLDADGDRYIRLDYDPWEDCLVISSGDEASYHQAKFLVDNEKTPFRAVPGDVHSSPAFNGARFIFTVESDLSGVISATVELGLDGDVRGVGDKWVLLQATLEYVAAYIGAVKELIGVRTGEFGYEIAEIERDLRLLGRNPEPGQEVYISSRRIIDVAHKIDALREDAGIPQEKIDQKMCEPGRSRFAIGSEETGHAITMTVMTTESGRRIMVYFGNGFKSAVNDILATTALFPAGNSDPAAYYHFISNPFSRGHKENYYTYFTNKSLFADSSCVFIGLQSMWQNQIPAAFASRHRKIRAVPEPKAEEPNMLFLKIQEFTGNEWKTIGSAFCRNSGTEPKTTVYVRGRKDDSVILGEVVDAARRYIGEWMKDRNSPEVRAQIAIVNILRASGQMAKTELIARLHAVDPNFERVDLNAVIGQTRDKEEIIEGTLPSNNPMLRLNPKRSGWFIDEIIEKPSPIPATGSQTTAMAAGAIPMTRAMARRLSNRGVHVVGPIGSVLISEEAIDQIGAGTVIHSGAHIELGKQDSIGNECVIKGTVIRSTLGNHCQVARGDEIDMAGYVRDSQLRNRNIISGAVINCSMGDNNKVKRPVANIVWAGNNNNINAEINFVRGEIVNKTAWIGDNCSLEGSIVDSVIGDGTTVEGASIIRRSVILPYRIEWQTGENVFETRQYSPTIVNSSVENSEFVGGGRIGPSAHVRSLSLLVNSNIHLASETARTIHMGVGPDATVEMPHKNYMHGIAYVIMLDSEYDYGNPEAYSSELRSKYEMMLMGKVISCEQENVEIAREYGIEHFEGETQPVLVWKVLYNGEVHTIKTASVNIGAISTTSNFMRNAAEGGTKAISIFEAGATVGMYANLYAPVVVGQGTIVGTGAKITGYKVPRDSVMLPEIALDAKGAPLPGGVLPGYRAADEGRLTDSVAVNIELGLRAIRTIHDFARVYSETADKHSGLERFGVLKALEIFLNQAQDSRRWNQRYLNAVRRSLDLLDSDLATAQEEVAAAEQRLSDAQEAEQDTSAIQQNLNKARTKHQKIAKRVEDQRAAIEKMPEHMQEMDSIVTDIESRLTEARGRITDTVVLQEVKASATGRRYKIANSIWSEAETDLSGLMSTATLSEKATAPNSAYIYSLQASDSLGMIAGLENFRDRTVLIVATEAQAAFLKTHKIVAVSEQKYGTGGACTEAARRLRSRLGEGVELSYYYMQGEELRPEFAAELAVTPVFLDFTKLAEAVQEMGINIDANQQAIEQIDRIRDIYQASLSAAV